MTDLIEQNEMQVVSRIPATHASLNITWQGQNGDLVDPIPVDASDDIIKGVAAESVRAGGVPGISQDENATFQDFVVDRFPPEEGVEHGRIYLRPKVPFGSL